MPENEPVVITIQGSMAYAIRERATAEGYDLNDFGGALVSLGWAVVDGMSDGQRDAALRLVRKADLTNEVGRIKGVVDELPREAT